MEEFQKARDEAKKNIKIADHMLSVTYPLIKDPKLLLAIIENIFLAYTNAMNAIVYYDRLFKRIPPFQDSFESRFNVFRQRCLIKHNLPRNFATEIQELKDIITEHKNSPIEFSRNDKFVICSDNYRIKTISLNDIKNYIEKAKLFIQAMDNIVGKDGLFR